MVRKVCRTALLVAALAAVPFAFGAVQVGGAHAQTPGVCLTDPSSGAITCVDENGNPIDQIAAPIPVLPPVAAAAPANESCYVDELGNLVCPTPVYFAPLTQPSDAAAQQPLLEPATMIPQAQPAQSEPQVSSATGQNCSIAADGSVSCM